MTWMDARATTFLHLGQLPFSFFRVTWAVMQWWQKTCAHTPVVAGFSRVSLQMRHSASMMVALWEGRGGWLCCVSSVNNLRLRVMVDVWQFAGHAGKRHA